MPVRDSQRSKVYRLDTVLEKRIYDAIGFGSTLQNLSQCRLLAECCLATFGLDLERPLAVKPGRGTRRAFGGAWGISLPLWARKAEVVIHEAAHTIHYRTIKCRVSPHQAGHGPEYVRILIHLVSTLYGIEESLLLEDAKTLKVKVAPKSLITDIKKLVKEKNI